MKGDKGMTGMNKKLIWTGVFLTVLALLHFGVAGPATAEPKGTLKMAIHWGVSGDYNDPSLAGDYMGCFNLYFYHDALLKPMPAGRYTPSLAESWTISPDFKVYTFNLRKGVKFHNGDEMTAEDVVFTFQRYKARLASKLLHSKIEKLEAVDPYTFRVTFNEPFLDFLDYFIPAGSTIGWVVPKKYVEKVGDEAYKNQPVGAGPYRVVEFKPGVRLVGEAYEHFWRKEPNVKRLEFYLIGEAATRYAMVTKGEVDGATLMQDVFYEKLKKSKTLRMLNPLSPTIWMLFFQKQFDKNDPSSNLKVRQAASLYMDRQLIADVHAPGGGATGSFSLSDDPTNLNIPADPYDPEKAKKLMAEAGYPNGFNEGKYYPFDGPYWPFGEQVATYLKKIGITMETVLYDRPSWFANNRSGKMVGGTMITPLAQPTAAGRFAQIIGGAMFNYGSYPEIQALWDKHEKSVNPKERTEIIKKMQQLNSDMKMYIPIMTTTSPAAFGPKWKGNPYGIQPLMWYVCPMEDIQINE